MTLNNRAKSILQDITYDYINKWGGFDAFDSEDQEAISQILKLTN